MSSFKILIGYPYYPAKDTYGDVEKIYIAYVERLKKAGFDVEAFCLTLNPPSYNLTFKELDQRWRRGDKFLLDMYEKLEKALEGKDVFINWSGINLHPEFVKKLSVFSVFQCFDDPESSADLSKPVASAYDLCLVGNIAEVDTYRSWGVRFAEWSPLGFQSTIYDPNLTYSKIINSERDIDLFLMMDRTAPWRSERVNKLAQAFPDAHFYGRGWPRGYLSNVKELEYLRRTKIGPNIHNSTGPINYRTFYLPANGVMQICDNKSHLGKIYELGKEVVGFDTMEECIELCRYYLVHDQERREIAANGWKRAITDYNEIAIFNRKIKIIETYILPRVQKQKTKSIALSQFKSTSKQRLRYALYSPFVLVFRALESVAKKISRRYLPEEWRKTLKWINVKLYE
ncbi:MAG: glycosyltransferase [Candidatus Omnitrophica bacterium]|nr:glycosyltransferase [Candidatus Omnitrophota bacterium]